MHYQPGNAPSLLNLEECIYQNTFGINLRQLYCCVHINISSLTKWYDFVIGRRAEFNKVTGCSGFDRTLYISCYTSRMLWMKRLQLGGRSDKMKYDEPIYISRCVPTDTVGDLLRPDDVSKWRNMATYISVNIGKGNGSVPSKPMLPCNL